MKRLNLILFVLVFFGFSLNAQRQISGKVFDDEKNPVYGAIVILDNGKSAVFSTDEYGNYIFKNVADGNHEVRVEHSGFVTAVENIELKNDLELDFSLEVSEINELERIIVSGTRAAERTPMAFSVIEQKELEKQNIAQDVPYMLRNTPGITVSSDGGVGVGYSQMRVRGTDISRINVTLNGIPMNDPESHGVWWVDIPDFASSVDNIQIQRGVGTSTNGAGAFGASINLRTNKIKTKPAFEISNSFGSFNTQKNTISFATGTINDHFVLEGRLSRLHTDGYIDNAWADMKSYYVSGAYFDKKTLVKVNVFSGVEDTYQAWNGVPKVKLENDTAGMKNYLDHYLYSQEEYDKMVAADPRTYNKYSYENEIDHYQQTHYQLHIVRKIIKNLNFEAAGFLIHGEGYYEQYKDGKKLKNYGLEPAIIGNDTIKKTDFITRKWLDNNYYGVNYNLVYAKDRLKLLFGGSWNKYDGNHFGNVIWMKYAHNTSIRHEWYRNLGVKSDLNNYLKCSYDLFDMVNLFADMQYRLLDYSIDGTNDDLEKIGLSQTYNFFNPKVGFVYHPNDKHNIYFSYAIANKEPKRADFIDAPTDATPKAETLFDYELGYRITKKDYSFDLNLYYMDYKNQLIMTGEVNDVGTAIATNVKDSYRRGVEVAFGTKFFGMLNWNINGAFSQNKIKNFTEYVDNWDYWNDPTNNPMQIENKVGLTDLAFSPSIVANNVISVDFLRYFNAEITTHYVSRQYIDNSSSEARSIDPYLLNDFALRASFNTAFVKNITVGVKVNNFLNEKYETFAWVYSYYTGGKRYAMDGYFPQAGTNFMANLTIKF